MSEPLVCPQGSTHCDRAQECRNPGECSMSHRYNPCGRRIGDPGDERNCVLISGHDGRCWDQPVHPWAHLPHATVMVDAATHARLMETAEQTKRDFPYKPYTHSVVGYDGDIQK